MSGQPPVAGDLITPKEGDTLLGPSGSGHVAVEIGRPVLPEPPSSSSGTVSNEKSKSSASSSRPKLSTQEHELVDVALSPPPSPGRRDPVDDAARMLDNGSSGGNSVGYNYLDPEGGPAVEFLTDLVNRADKYARDVLPPNLHQYLNKGDVSNFVTFLIMLLGIFLNMTIYTTPELRATNYILAFGLFGFAGGFTNWLAIKMLFEKVCGLPGSGVIPARFKEIRTVVKGTIMKAFFDDEFLNSYLESRGSGLLKSMDIGGKVAEFVSAPDFESGLKTKLEEISQTPEGMMLQMVKQMFGGSFDALLPMVRPVLITLAKDLGDNIDLRRLVSVDRVKTEIDLLMTEKLELLTPELVKTLLEEMIRSHLGWLVLWGNIFGGLIGLFSMASGLGY
ncbi:unnamed protein product [Amoebophrya sp. A25]|nr:unnamed protein product [Amoebophrya sp. A25]|eukprot:GSA25T00025947001.1